MILYDMPAGLYHADPCESPSLSASLAKTLVTESPAKAWRQHPKLGGIRKAGSKEMARGDIIHALVLDQPLKHVQVLKYENYRTKAAQIERDALTESGMTPVLQWEFDECIATAGAIRRQIRDFGIKLEGQSEATILWETQSSKGKKVQCRSRLDHLHFNDQACIFDLKNCANASLPAIKRTILNFGYDLQAAAYIRAVENADPSYQGRVKFLFLFVESEDPYPVTPVYLDGSFLSLGASKWRRAVDIWAECLESNVWPSYVTEPATISPPEWAVKEEFDQPSPSTIAIEDFLV